MERAIAEEFQRDTTFSIRGSRKDAKVRKTQKGSVKAAKTANRSTPKKRFNSYRSGA
jgi:hypothetical protein